MSFLFYKQLSSLSMIARNELSLPSHHRYKAVLPVSCAKSFRSNKHASQNLDRVRSIFSFYRTSRNATSLHPNSSHTPLTQQRMAAPIGGGRIAAYDGFMDDNDEGIDDAMNSYYSSGHQREEGGGGPGSVTTDDRSLPDNLLLAHFCATAKPPRDGSEEARQEADETWEPVREWLRTHEAGEVKAATEQLGESNMTALHFACRNVPPRDVIEVFLSIAQDVVQWPDSFGWLPIHYACACGADVDVIRNLADAFPDSKTTVDRRGRTPLHFALGSSTPERPVSPAVVVLLSSSGAASYADDNGMLVRDYMRLESYGRFKERFLSSFLRYYFLLV